MRSDPVEALDEDLRQAALALCVFVGFVVVFLIVWTGFFDGPDRPCSDYANQTIAGVPADCIPYFMNGGN